MYSITSGTSTEFVTVIRYISSRSIVQCQSDVCKMGGGSNREILDLSSSTLCAHLKGSLPFLSQQRWMKVVIYQATCLMKRYFYSIYRGNCLK